jgi:hypothetical protein
VNPEYQQPSFTPVQPVQTPGDMQPAALPPLPKPKRSKKRLAILIAVALLVIGGVLFFIFSGSKKTDKDSQQSTNHGPQVITFSAAKDAVTYAGNPVYDACNLFPIDLVKTHIENYKETLASLGGDKKLKDPLVMEHGYIDRSVPAIQGKDGIPREPKKGISETKVDSSIRSPAFISIGDSHCQYGQGQNFNTEVAAIYIMQPPVPLPPQLVSYLAELKQKGRMAIESQGVEVYVEPVVEGDSVNTSIFRKGNTVVFMTSRKFELIQAASEAIVNTLSKPPAGPMIVTYPSMYSKMTDSCALFPATDFERLMGKPSSAVISEELGLTEWEDATTHRECTRIEVERFKEGEISSVRTTLEESRTEEQTKNRVNALKSDKDNKTTALNGLGDEAYVVTNNLLSTPRYSIVIRVGKMLITVESNGESKDTNVDSFTSRTQPVAKVIVENYKKK